jgi:predicted aspartyl protease
MKSLQKKISNLRSVGPFVEVTIYDPAFPSNPVKGMALIDTGATCSCIDATVAKRLNLIGYNKIQVFSPTGNMMSDMYEVEIIFSELIHVPIESLVLSADLTPQPYLALIGRDILSDFIFTYNGKENSYQLEL